ncbi:SOS response-associated peptidase family protein [Muricauda sp. CAU 1633]|uniref:SOS response-associated peptidase n=1 Tax=Allomuricauda sp. CAU 1633 TaxID=2816036 RepID=UPI001A908979|nr:SOS response-associated peptidase family protein [Muricauda sp. CAU 1633]MBO0321429.1 SOS response-associated peptidase family protein [Muricauda sp. CAU 1633]
MIYKLSNVAERTEIEEEFGLHFKYPHLYTPSAIIDGFKETNISVVTTEDKHKISFAIWGLMPQDFKEDWHIFQNNANTLNVQLQDLERVKWMKESFTKRRCLIIVSGFYTHLLKNGKMHTYYVSLENEKPFYLAGVYNVLEDGFQCCALVMAKTNAFVSSYHDISDLAPIIIPKAHADLWLANEFDIDNLKDIINNPPEVKLKAHLMADEFFKDTIPAIPFYTLIF